MVRSIIDFKTARAEKEFFLVHPLLRAALYEMGYATHKKDKSILMVTSLIRKPRENEKVGGKKLSAHLFARAADCRVWNLPEGNFVGTLIAQIKDTYGNKIHIIRHTGTADHIHLNVNFKYAEQFTEVYYAN